MEPYALSIALEILKILGGIFVPVMTIGITIYAKKLENKMGRKAVRDEISRHVLAGEQVKFFSSMKDEDKVSTVLEAVGLFVMESGIAISDVELRMMIEQALSTPRKLAVAGMKLGLVNKDAIKE